MPAATSSWEAQLDDLRRATFGGLLFGIPLVYTMEVWWAGSTLPRFWAPGALLGALALAIVLDRTTGFRFNDERNWGPSIADGIEVIAVALVITTLMLLLFGELTTASPLQEAVTKIVAETLPFAIGAALTNEFLQQLDADDDDESDDADGSGRNLFGVAGMATVGAIVLGLAIAPTDEVTLLAANADGLRPVGFVLAALLISHIIVFESSARGGRRGRRGRGSEFVIGETLLAYVVTFIASAGMLFLYGRVTIGDPWPIWFVRTAVLALPATVGGAAGRLAL